MWASARLPFGTGRIVELRSGILGPRVCANSVLVVFSAQVSKELQEAAKYEITGTRVFRQKMNHKLRFFGQARRRKWRRRGRGGRDGAVIPLFLTF